MEKTNSSGVFKSEGKKKDITYYIRFKKNGTSQRLKVGKKSEGMTEREAKRILERKKDLIASGKDDSTISISKNVEITITSKMSLNSLATIYFDKKKAERIEGDYGKPEENEGMSLENIRRKASVYNTFWLNWEYSQIPFHKVTTENFVARLREIKKMKKIVVINGIEEEVDKYKAKYIDNHIKGVIQTIIKNTHCTHNPIKIRNSGTDSDEKLKRITKTFTTAIKTVEAKGKSWLTPEEINLLLATLKGNKNHYQGYIIALIMATTGMRPDAVLNLKISDFDIKSKKIRAFDFKRTMSYQCNLIDKVWEEIQVLFKRKLSKDELLEIKSSKKEVFVTRPTSDYLIYSINSNGKTKLKNTPDYLGRTIRNLFNGNRDDNKKVKLYSLRHSFATNLVIGEKDENGDYSTPPTSIFYIQRLLNHADIKTTIRHYAQFSPEFAEDAIEDMAARFT